MTTAHAYYILGDGLAAILMARELVAQGVAPDDIVLCAPPSKKASDVPGALMHPLPGTTLAPKPDTMLAYAHARRCILDWHSRHPEHVHITSMLRPDRGGRKGARFVKTYTRGMASYHDSMIHCLITREAIDACAPGLHHDAQRAVLYGATYCVALGALLPTLREELVALGTHHHPYLIDSMRQNQEGNWELLRHGDPDPVASARRVVLAMGAGIAQWFPALEVHVNGGELAVIEADPAVDLDVMISGGGHVSPMPASEPRAWVMGSTYLRPTAEKGEHDDGAFDRSDEAAVAQLRDMIGAFYPPVRMASVRRLWRGQRAVYTPDKHPLVGAHPAYSGVFILGALGSKGLLWGPLAAHQLGQLLLGPDVPTLSAPCDVQRAPLEAWRSPNILPFHSSETSS